MSSCLRTTTPFPQATRQPLQQETNQWVQVNFCRKRSPVCNEGCLAEYTNASIKAWYTPQSPKPPHNRLSSCQTIHYIFFPFHLFLGKYFFLSLGEVAIKNVSPREMGCAKGFVGQKEGVQGRAGWGSNTDKYLEGELYVHPGRLQGESGSEGGRWKAWQCNQWSSSSG